MKKKVGPYVGVTGFMSRSEVEKGLRIVPPGAAHRLMVGVLLSSKTFADKPNKWPNRYPKKEDIANIFVDDPRALNLIHYSTDDHTNLEHQLSEITEFVGTDRFDGFQLNIKWPSATELRNYQLAYPEKLLVLQVGGKALTDVERFGLLSSIIYLLYDHRDSYSWMIDAILVDPSGGKGQQLDIERAMGLLQDIHREFPDLGIGFAGGLGPATIDIIAPFAQIFSGKISCDAEGQLRTPHPEDKLSISKMESYGEDAFIMMSGKKLPGWRFQELSGLYGFDGHLRNYGNGDNMLRTPRLAQPRALQVGDVLATGDRVLSLPREGPNGSIFLHLSGGLDGHWIDVPSRIPISLLTPEDGAPSELWNLR